MRLTDLNPGDKFDLDGQPLEVDFISPSGRVCMAYVLDGNGKRVNDPDDLVGDQYQQIVFSDTRFNRQHETQYDKDLDDIL